MYYIIFKLKLYLDVKFAVTLWFPVVLLGVRTLQMWLAMIIDHLVMTFTLSLRFICSHKHILGFCETTKSGGGKICFVIFCMIFPFDFHYTFFAVFQMLLFGNTLIRIFYLYFMVYLHKNTHLHIYSIYSYIFTRIYLLF